MADTTDNLDEWSKALDVKRRNIAFAAIVAATRTAGATKGFLSKEAGRVFDRPVPFTVNAFFSRPATKADPVAIVGVKDFAPHKGIPAAKYLAAQILGGTRRQKRSERAFGHAGVLGNNGFWVPGPGVTLNAYGNVPGSTMRRIISDVQADGQVGYLANRTARSVKRNKRYKAERYFVPRPGSRLAPGVWVERPRGSGKIMPALLFVPTVSYARRFDFFGRGMEFAVKQYPVELRKALDRELARSGG